LKTALVTGATDGIGFETARQLAAQGLRVLVHGRDADKAGAAARRIAGDTRGATVEPVAADLSRMAEVVALARTVQAKAPALDVLLNNAGVYLEVRQLTPDRLETTLAVNHFAPFLLTHHLLEAVKRAPRGRVVTVSSMAHASGEIDAEDLSPARGYTGYGAYSTSKLANILFTVALAKRLADTPVTANCLHPGVIGTKLLRAGFGMGGGSVERGARTSVYLATSPEVDGVTGKYFVDCRAATPSRRARDERLAEVLWEASARTLAAWL
jgi:NAD(P)-dependent dehydrogenase (short-subunit alcohol dehydrogenase family)